MTVPDYDSKSDDELLCLTLEPDSLTDEARMALSAELKKRNLDSPERLTKFSEEQRRYKYLDEISIGHLGLSARGIGRRLYSRSNIELHGTAEEYDSIVFAVVLYFPLVPMGNYRLQREQGSKQFKVLAKKPLDWIQVGIVWAKALAVAATIPVILNIFVRISIR